jgi:hypothetical protein
MFGSIAAQSGSFASLVAVVALVDWARQLNENRTAPISITAPNCVVLGLVLVLVHEPPPAIEDEDENEAEDD